MDVIQNIKEGKYDPKFPYDASDEYKEEFFRLYEQFEQDLYEQYGLKNHPKAKRFFEMARSTSSSHLGIAWFFRDYVDILITDVYVIEVDEDPETSLLSEAFVDEASMKNRIAELEKEEPRNHYRDYTLKITK